ncbi:MAG: hypothetical protein EOO88_00125 [Pedobacter sp.]|nr:MAG: hypothetical protein EOO88_00125 [Pedobacter sp.]
MKKFLYLFAILLIASPVLTAQTRYTVTELKTELSIIRAALKESHAGAYRYTDSLTLEKEFAVLESKLTAPLTGHEFYKLVNPVLALIRDGHTKFHISGKPDDLFGFSKSGYFPLALYWIGSKAFVRANPYHIPAGAELTAINAKPVGQIKTQIFSNMLVDGYEESMKYAYINENFPGYYGAFVGTFSSFEITFRFKGKTTKKTIRGTQAASFSKSSVQKRPYVVDYTVPGTAIIKISAFQPGHAGLGFEDFLEKTFQTITKAKIAKIILDLRDNEGGIDAYGIKLYARLTDKPFSYYDRFTVAGPPDYSFSKYATIPTELQYLRPFIKKVGKEYHFMQKDGLGEQSPAKLNFTGTLVILTNGRSFSVTSEFASIARDNNRAIFIGEPTGGAAEGNTSGTFIFLHLPYTKLDLAIPVLGYHMKLSHLKSTGKGVMPDHLIIPSITDVLHGRDRALEKALSIR